MIETALLSLLGAAVGALGTLIGAGGGFVLMPTLVLMHPNERPEALAAVSLAVVMVNAGSGSVAYGRLGWIDYRAGAAFAAAALPGAVAGAMLGGSTSRAAFDIALGVTLATISAWIGLRSARATHAGTPQGGEEAPPHTGRFYAVGCLLSVAVGFAASFLGIGGGVIHVPLLVYALGMAVHRAAATSHFVLAITALAATAAHLLGGDLRGQWATLIPLGIGAAVGAQAGARLARRAPARAIVRALAAALLLIGARIAWAGLRAW